MFIFTEPYVSELAQEFISENNNRVIYDSMLERECDCKRDVLLTREAAAARLLEREGRWIYSNSENALTWLDKTLPAEHRLRRCIELFKNKFLFRETYAEYFPEVKFASFHYDELVNLQYADFGEPFIIKPTVGFLSAGVYRVGSQDELDEVLQKLAVEMENIKDVFPESVLDSSSFLLEGIIEGREFAIDAFFSDDDEPVIVNIFEHIFRDKADMSDRLYITSVDTIKEFLEPFKKFLKLLQEKADLKGFVLHAEVRVGDDGVIKPIEINPLRFAGWCTTDLSYWAYGINPYKCFAERKEPDWQGVFSADNGKVYGMSVLSNSKCAEVQKFDYDKLQQRFNDLKELRKVDHNKFPLFGFAFFAEDKNNNDFFDWLLKTDLLEFCE